MRPDKPEPLNDTHILANGVWLPKSLKQGDIVRCDLLTNYEGNLNFNTRNCLVLGVELDQTTGAFDGLWLARFSYNTAKEREHDLFIDGIAAQHVKGLRNPVLLRTNRVDLVQVSPESLNKVVHINGAASPDVFPTINEHLQKGLAGPDAEASRDKGQYAASGVPIAGLQTQDMSSPYAFAGVPDFVIPDDKPQYVRPEPEKPKRKLETREDKRTRELVDAYRAHRDSQQTANDNAQSTPSNTKQGIVASAQTRTIPDGLVEEAEAALADDIDGKLIGSDTALTSQLLEVNGVSFGRANAYRLAAQSFAQLPPTITEGDIVTAHIADLRKQGDKRKVYRPCVVMDVFEDEKTGEPVGLMMLPCSRISQWRFPDKIRLKNPFGMRGPQYTGSFVLTGRVAIVPISQRYFPEKHNISNHLPDFQYARIQRAFRQTLEERPENIRIYGKNVVPSNWVSRRAKRLEAEKVRSETLSLKPTQVKDVRSLISTLNAAKSWLAERFERSTEILTQTFGIDASYTNEEILSAYIQLRREGNDFDLKDIASFAGKPIQTDDDEKPLEEVQPRLKNPIKKPVLQKNIQVGDVINFKPPIKGRLYRRFDSTHEERGTRKGLVWTVFKDHETDEVSGVGVIPFYDDIDNFSPEAIEDPLNWNYFCQNNRDAKKAGAPRVGRWAMNTLHLLPNNDHFFTRNSQSTGLKVDSEIMPSLVRKRELALLNARCINKGLRLLPRHWVFDKGPEYQDGIPLNPMPPNDVESLVFAPDLRKVIQSFEHWQKSHNILPTDHVSKLPELFVDNGLLVENHHSSASASAPATLDYPFPEDNS